MNDKVIYPSQFAQLHRASSSRREGTSRDHSAKRIARLLAIEGAGGKKGPVFLKKSDRIAAARAVGRLVQAAKTKGVTVETIKEKLEEKATPGKKPGTSRLDRYMLSARLDAEQAEARSDKLQQRVRGYLDVAEAVAAFADMNVADAKCEVLVETSLWSRASEQPSDQDERAARLALGLSEMGKYVIRQSKLPEIFERARRIPGVWDVINHRFKPSTMACMSQSAFLEGLEHWVEAPPLPSIPLVRHLHSMLIVPVNVAIEGTVQPAEIVGDFEEQPHAAAARFEWRMKGEALQAEEFEGTERIGTFLLSREIRLVLGPTTDPATIGVMFESRAQVTLAFDEEHHQIYPNISLKPIDDLRGDLPSAVLQVSLGQRWHKVRTLRALDEAQCFVIKKGDEVNAWSPNPLRSESPFEHWYFSWTACNEETVRHWLDRPLRPKGGVETCVPITGFRPSRGELWYAKPSSAFEIESALASGALEKALFEQIEALAEQLAIREREWREDATTTMSELVHGWRSQESKGREN